MVFSSRRPGWRRQKQSDLSDAGNQTQPQHLRRFSPHILQTLIKPGSQLLFQWAEAGSLCVRKIHFSLWLYCEALLVFAKLFSWTQEAQQSPRSKNEAFQPKRLPSTSLSFPLSSTEDYVLANSLQRKEWRRVFAGGWLCVIHLFFKTSSLTTRRTGPTRFK